LTRSWEPGTFPPAETLLAILTLAAIPQALATRLSTHLSGGIAVGPGSVPDLPGFEWLRGVALPLQAGRWERSAGVYDPRQRRIGVGSAPSPSVSVCGHEIGHATDHMDRLPSHSPFWTGLHTRTRDRLRPPYRDDVTELFAEAFACVLTRRATRLLHLIGEESEAEHVYHRLSGQYGIG